MKIIVSLLAALVIAGPAMAEQIPIDDFPGLYAAILTATGACHVTVVDNKFWEHLDRVTQAIDHSEPGITTEKRLKTRSDVMNDDDRRFLMNFDRYEKEMQREMSRVGKTKWCEGVLAKLGPSGADILTPRHDAVP